MSDRSTTFRLSRRALLAGAAMLTLPASAAVITGAPEEIASGVTFLYFGAGDCPYCDEFRRNDLAELRDLAADAGIRLVLRETESLRDLRKGDPFAEWNPVWQLVKRRSGPGVPAFALVDTGAFVDSRAGEWRDLMVRAIARAAKTAGAKA